MRTRRTSTGALVLLIGGLLLTACGGSGNVSLPTARPSLSLPTVPSRTATPAPTTPTSEPPTSAAPSDTSAAPTVSDTATATDAASTTPTPSETPTTTPTSATPTPTPTPTKTTPTPTPTPTTPSATPTPTPTSASPTSDSATPTSSSPTASPSVTIAPTAAPMPDSSSTPWWPWALLVAILAVLGGIWAVVGGKRRRWDAAFAKDLGEARWAVDSLVPSITNRALPAEQVAAQWPDGKRRLDDLQSDLYRLGTDIPSSERAAKLGAVSGALGALQQSLESDVALRPTAVGPEGETALAASMQDVVGRREALIAAIAGTPPGGSHQA
jgi:hypothetical protein